MERPKDLKSAIITGAIVLFHLVGLIGLAVPGSRSLFLSIVPWHLLLMFMLICINHKQPDNKFLVFVALLFLCGYGVEYVGVHTGLLFGHYTYDGTLGLKIGGIPLTIGINWMLLIYCTGVVMQKTRLISVYLQAVFGALLLVLLDVLIEPIAIKLHYWHWEGNQIPAKNYVCWFLVSAVMLYLFERFKFKGQNRAAPVLLLAQFVFFALLHLLII